MLFNTRVICYVFVALSAVAVSASASTPLKISIADQPNAPIAINECFGGLGDTAVGNVDYYLSEAVIFTNQSPRTASVIRFRFDYYDAFDAHLGERYGILHGTFSPGIVIDQAHSHIGTVVPAWQFINIWGDTEVMKCSVDTVKFVDGSVWNAGDPAPTETQAAPHNDTPAIVETLAPGAPEPTVPPTPR